MSVVVALSTHKSAATNGNADAMMIMMDAAVLVK